MSSNKRGSGGLYGQILCKVIFPICLSSGQFKSFSRLRINKLNKPSMCGPGMWLRVTSIYTIGGQILYRQQQFNEKLHTLDSALPFYYGSVAKHQSNNSSTPTSSINVHNRSISIVPPEWWAWCNLWACSILRHVCQKCAFVAVLALSWRYSIQSQNSFRIKFVSAF